MSLLLGNDVFISSRQLLVILNLREPASLENFFIHWQGQHGAESVRRIGVGPYRSAVVCPKGICYLTPTNARTLAKRARANAKAAKSVKLEDQDGQNETSHVTKKKSSSQNSDSQRSFNGREGAPKIAGETDAD